MNPLRKAKATSCMSPLRNVLAAACISPMRTAKSTACFSMLPNPKAYESYVALFPNAATTRDKNLSGLHCAM